MNIGFIGCGNMGNPMVRRFLKHQHQVMVYDINKEAILKLTEVGAKAALSIQEIAEQSDVVMTSLQTGLQLKDVCLGVNGLFSHINAGALLIDYSSIDIETCRQIHRAAKQKNIGMLDAPVSGGVPGAEAGMLTIMVGGSVENFQRALPLLQGIGQKIIHVGNEGNGVAAKICNNMILGSTMIASCEAFALAECLGLSPEKLYEIVSNASGSCFALTNNAPIPGLSPYGSANNNFQAGFSAKMMLKDLTLSQISAQATNSATPLGALARALYQMFVNQGGGELDFSAMIKMIAENGGDK